jgi:hypothetical protein
MIRPSATQLLADRRCFAGKMAQHNQDRRHHSMKTITYIAAIFVPMLLAACANMATQQKPGLDNADRLFLKYVEISKRPTLLTPDDMTQINHLSGLISARKKECEQRKNEAMRPVWTLVVNNYKNGVAPADLPATHAAALTELKRIETTSISSCGEHGFPQGAIN